jgi:hypothetical protein
MATNKPTERLEMLFAATYENRYICVIILTAGPNLIGVLRDCQPGGLLSRLRFLVY